MGVLGYRKSEIDCIVGDVIDVVGGVIETCSEVDCTKRCDMYSVEGLEKNSQRHAIIFITEYFNVKSSPFVLDIVVDEAKPENCKTFVFDTVDDLILNLGTRLTSEYAKPKLGALLSHIEGRMTAILLGVVD